LAIQICLTVGVVARHNRSHPSEFQEKPVAEPAAGFRIFLLLHITSTMLISKMSRREIYVDQKTKAAAFQHMHQSGNPLILYNIWDFGSARAVADAGAKALATGSWSVAASQGYDDGEQIPKETLFKLAEAISSRIDLPLSVDFEGGYAVDPEEVAANVHRLITAGATGLNFEDQVVGSEQLHPIALQMKRINAIQKVGLGVEIPIFINARTDYFLNEEDTAKHAGLLAQAIERGHAFTEVWSQRFFCSGTSRSRFDCSGLRSGKVTG